MYAIVLQAHQKINKTARRHLKALLPEGTFFPMTKSIMHFEGRNGPDAAKLKRPNQEQPWHFIDPEDATDDQLLRIIEAHYQQLVKALSKDDLVRSSFEAAWLAHAIVDGLTPAHHYPYEAELSRLRGESRHTRNGIVGRAFVRGADIRDSFQRSLKLIGPGGLLTTHAMFEGGAWAIMKPLRLETARPTEADLRRIREAGLGPVFLGVAKEVAQLRLYHRFMDWGWTHRLSRDVRRELAPRMVRMVTLAWYAAACEADALREQA